MKLFNKKVKNENKEDEIIVEGLEQEKVLNLGDRDLRSVLAPEGIIRNKSELIIDRRLTRVFYFETLARMASFMWLDDLYSSSADVDVNFHIIPTDQKSSAEELNNDIIKINAEAYGAKVKSDIANITKLESDLQKLMEQKVKLEQNQEKIFKTIILFSVTAEDEKTLEKEASSIIRKLEVQGINISEAYLRQGEAYTSVLPFGVNLMRDKALNINSGGLTASFPFYKGEINDETGIFLGLNRSTGAPVIHDVFLRDNYSMVVIGGSGAGKTFALSLYISRSAFRGRQNIFIDPEGEFEGITKMFGGKVIKLGTKGKSPVNPFDLEEQVLNDGSRIVDIKEKIGEMVTMIAIMVGGLDKEQESAVSVALKNTYKQFGFNEDPESLYQKTTFDKESQIIGHSGIKKEMPCLSDIVAQIKELPSAQTSESIKVLINALEMYTNGNAFDIFDTHTDPDYENISNECMVDFDITGLEGNKVLKTVGMYVAFTWIWEKFVKKNPSWKKVVTCDEGWMLLDKNMPGSEYTGPALENAARRYRKRQASLVIASQGISELTSTSHGEAILRNAKTKLIFGVDASEIEKLQEHLNLSDGERRAIATSTKGDCLLKADSDSVYLHITPFQFEEEMIIKAKKLAKTNG